MIGDTIELVSTYLNSFTGVEGTLGYLAILILVLAGHFIINSGNSSVAVREQKQQHEPEAEKEEIKTRNFTAVQLEKYDGTVDPKTDENNPVYLSLNGIVFDVSDGRDFYGPGGPYEQFAGHECGAALAKMSFDTSLLDDMELCDKLNFGEKTELENWIEKFKHYQCYPVMGRLVPNNKLPSSERKLSHADLKPFDGHSQEIPDGYAAAPIYVGAGDKVFDVSFGGVDFYGPGCPYNVFAGKDASRALAKVSIDPQDVSTADLSDLNEKQLKTLDDWINTYENKKGYPCVGRLNKN